MSKQEAHKRAVMTTRKKRTRIRFTSRSELDGFWPSHTPFDQILDYHVVVGDTPRFVRDHVAELSELLGYDTDPAFWFDKTAKEGIRTRKILYQLADKVKQATTLALRELCMRLPPTRRLRLCFFT